jgi:hypothetical protein
MPRIHAGVGLRHSRAIDYSSVGDSLACSSATLALRDDLDRHLG